MQQNITAGTDLTATVINNWAPDVQSGTVTPATHWSLTSFNAVWNAGITTIQVELTYSGSTITASSTGFITATLVCTLPYTPPFQMWVIYQVTQTSAGSLLIDTNSNCSIQTLYPTASIASGATIYFTASIPTG